MALLGLIGNVYGGVQFDMNWKSAVNSEAWNKAVNAYVNLATKDGPPGVVGNGFNENLNLMSEGKCAIWNDATVAAGLLFDPKRSKVADKLGFAQNPVETWDKGGAWLWAWALGVPSSSKHADEAKKFIEWATSKEYINMIGDKEGWVTIPPGTRKSTYENPKYLEAAPFAKPTLEAIESASLTDNTAVPKPYVGINFPIIPEMQAINNFLGQQIAAALTGKMSVKDALDSAAANADRIMKKSGYPK
jgi:sorbitol/mannitol transport system substrate-binding protein